jgi:hypothetical protein
VATPAQHRQQCVQLSVFSGSLQQQYHNMKVHWAAIFTKALLAQPFIMFRGNEIRSCCIHNDSVGKCRILQSVKLEMVFVFGPSSTHSRSTTVTAQRVEIDMH